jgi:hypothetical protein
MKICALMFAFLLYLPQYAQAHSLAADTKSLMSCPMKLTFNTPAETQEWRALNDGVMGGRSSGAPSFEGGHMIFKGTINTNGGGFSSVRRSIDVGAMADMAGMNMRVRSDGRLYKLSLRTDASFNGRSIAFQAPIKAAKPGEWETVFVSFDDIKSSIFGRPVNGATFKPAAVNIVGIILADGQDGPFQLEVAWMEGCKNGDIAP